MPFCCVPGPPGGPPPHQSFGSATPRDDCPVAFGPGHLGSAFVSSAVHPCCRTMGAGPPPPKVRRPRGRRSVWGKGSHTFQSEIVGGIRARGLSLGSCTKRPPGMGHVLTTIADFRGSGVRDLHGLPRRIRGDSGMTGGIQKVRVSIRICSRLAPTGP